MQLRYYLPWWQNSLWNPTWNIYKNIYKKSMIFFLQNVKDFVRGLTVCEHLLFVRCLSASCLSGRSVTQPAVTFRESTIWSHPSLLSSCLSLSVSCFLLSDTLCSLKCCYESSCLILFIILFKFHSVSFCSHSRGRGELRGGGPASGHAEKHWGRQLLVYEQTVGRNTGLHTRTRLSEHNNILKTANFADTYIFFRTTTPSLSLESRTKWKL